MKYTLFTLLLLCSLVFLQVRHFLADGFYPMHDDTQVARVVVMGRALINGQFPVRWVSDLGYGYGYPIFNFYGPLPYYVGGFFYALGFSGLVSTKLMIGLGVLLAAISAYLLGSRTMGRLGGFLLGLSYSFMPYHAVQLYVRGAIGEFWATIFYPLVILGIWLLYKKQGGLLWLGFGISGVMLSHTLSGFFLGLVLFILLAVSVILVINNKLEKRQFFRLLISIGLGLGLSAFFWIPSILEMNYTNVRGQISQTANVFEHFVCVSQFWYSTWGFGGSVPGCQDGMSFALGRVFIFFTLLGMSVSLFSLKKKHQRELFLIGITMFFISLFLMFSISSFVWQVVPGLVFLQYPWRILSWTMMGMAILIALNVYSFSQRIIRLLLVSIFSFFIVTQGLEKFQPQYIYQKDPQSFETREELRFRASKVSDEYLPRGVIIPTNTESVVQQTIPSNPLYTLEQVVEKETYKKYRLESNQEAAVVVQQVHFPGWIYLVNGKEQPLILEDMLPVLTIPQGFSTIELIFKDTAIRRISNLISLTIVVVLVYIYGKKTFR